MMLMCVHVCMCVCAHVCVNTRLKSVTSGINNPGCGVGQFYVSSWLDSSGWFLLVKDHCGCGKSLHKLPAKCCGIHLGG